MMLVPFNLQTVFVVVPHISFNSLSQSVLHYTHRPRIISPSNNQASTARSCLRVGVNCESRIPYIDDLEAVKNRATRTSRVVSLSDVDGNGEGGVGSEASAQGPKASIL